MLGHVNPPTKNLPDWLLARWAFLELLRLQRPMNLKSPAAHPAVPITNLVLVNWHRPAAIYTNTAPLVTLQPGLYNGPMAVVRILVDGYSLLHAWSGLAPGKPRHSSTARDALVRILTQYRDAINTPLTIFFDGSGAPPSTPDPIFSEGIEVLYSKKGQTADDLIERTAYRLKPFGEALAITNDYAERDTVIAMGGLAQSCEEFIKIVEDTLAQQSRDIARHKRKENLRFRRPQ
ncbi:MAG: hypothetical protein CMO74_15430 [Verrucomicrobiales bacterium]|nr:hypothetical protein [Verrucomicrobiales bacterium]